MTTQLSNMLIQGRIVWTSGDLFKGKQKVHYQTKQPLTNTDGSPKIEYGFGLAIPKGTPEFTELWNLMHQEAFTIFPSGQLPPDFAMKMKDGNTAIDKKGKPYSAREGYAGHMVLTCTTLLPISYFKFVGANNQLISTGIKNGDYVNVQVNFKAHGAINNGNPGLYVNPSAVQFIQAGKEIINTPSGDDMFGQAAPAYAGQVVADTAPAVAPVAAPGMPAVGQAPVAPQMPVAAPAPVQPHYDVLPTTMQPGQAPVAPQMPVAAPQGNPASYVAPAPMPAPGHAAPGGYVAPVAPGNVAAPQMPNGAAPVAPAMPPMPQ